MKQTNYNLSDLFYEIAGLFKKYEECMYIKQTSKENDNIYSINEVIKIYPQLSKHILTKRINEGVLPVIRIGNHRYFNKKDIESLLVAKSEKNNYNKTWRHYESHINKS